VVVNHRFQTVWPLRTTSTYRINMILRRNHPISFIRTATHAMCMRLPIGYFRFLTEEEIPNFDLISVHGNADKGYMLEVDLEYSEVLHDLHSDYPLAPETKSVPDNILSPFSRKLWSKLNSKSKSSTDAKTRVQTRRLLCTLEDKHNSISNWE
jgi:hypothetical protein